MDEKKMVEEKYWLRRNIGGGEILVEEKKMVDEKYWLRRNIGWKHRLKS